MAMHIRHPDGDWRTIREIAYSPDIPGFNPSLVGSPNTRVYYEGNWQGVLDRVVLQSDNIVNTPPGTVSWTLSSDGTTSVEGNSPNSGGFQVWCQNPNNAKQYSVYAAASAGSVSGPFEQWLPLSSSYTWSLFDQFDNEGSFSVQIKNTESGQILVPGVTINLKLFTQ